MSSATMTSRKLSAAAATSIWTSRGPGGAAGIDRIDSPVSCPGAAGTSW